MRQPHSTGTATASFRPWVRLEPNRLSVEVVVRPGSARSEVLRAEERGLVIAIAVPAERGKANEELVRFLAKLVGVRPSAVSILKGEKARRKTVRIDVSDPSGCAAKLIPR